MEWLSGFRKQNGTILITDILIVDKMRNTGLMQGKYVSRSLIGVYGYV